MIIFMYVQFSCCPLRALNWSINWIELNWIELNIICKHYQKVIFNEWKYTNLTYIWVNLTLLYSLRAVYGTDDQRNALHGSDSFSSSEKEIRFFFPDSKWLCFFSNWCPVTCNIMCFKCVIFKNFSITIFTYHL